MNTLGLICAVVTFLGVWLGHVAVRYIEARAVSIRLPAALFAISGLALGITSLLVSSRAFSAVLGIMCVITMVDASELFRQEKRVIKGRAPANPQNPRHRQILAEHPAATSAALLKREPQGRPLSEAEIAAIREAAR